VIGNHKGKVGVGTAKDREVLGAVTKAVRNAQKNLVTIKEINGTVPHEIRVKYKSAKILILPASAGTGIIAGGAVRRVLKLAGYKNVLSKMFGSSNKINNARATLEALRLMKNPRKTANRKETTQETNLSGIVEQSPIQITKENQPIKKPKPKSKANLKNKK